MFIDFWAPVAIETKENDDKVMLFVSFSLISGPRWPLKLKANDVKNRTICYMFIDFWAPVAIETKGK